MQKLILLYLFVFSTHIVPAQTMATKLAAAVQQLEADPQFRYGTVGLCVVDALTGKVVYAHNAQTGLAAASTQKIFTSVAAFELLGPVYRYRTRIGYDGAVENGVLKGNLHIVGYGDPTLGSWRWNETKEEVILAKIAGALKQNHITKITGQVFINDAAFSGQPIPGGWIWDDMGNYYGAGCWAVNWHENQYELHLQPGTEEGDTTRIVKTVPDLQGAVLVNQITTGKKGSGDNGYIYLPPYSLLGFTQGTVPPGAAPFVIAGAFPDGPLQFAHALEKCFDQQHIVVEGAFGLRAGGVRLRRGAERCLPVGALR